MGESKIQYSDKKVTPLGGMKLLKDFIDTTTITKDLESANIPQLQSNAVIHKVANAWMRSGNTADLNNYETFSK